jgi:hypothetical protein
MKTTMETAGSSAIQRASMKDSTAFVVGRRATRVRTVSADRSNTNNQNMKVDAPININVRDAAEAKRVAATGVGNAVKAAAAVQPARMQAGPAR